MPIVLDDANFFKYIKDRIGGERIYTVQEVGEPMIQLRWEGLDKNGERVCFQQKYSIFDIALFNSDQEGLSLAARFCEAFEDFIKEFDKDDEQSD